MSQPYVGQILMVGFSFAPVGWMLCNGQTLPISENETLFNLIGTTYGGDGQETFQLPNLCGRVPLHMGTGSSGTSYTIGEAAGVENVTLNTQQIPNHNHTVQVLEAPGALSKPGGNILATEALSNAQATSFTYGAFGGTQSTLAPATLQPSGGSQPHDNMQEFLTVNFVISLFGIFPTQN